MSPLRRLAPVAAIVALILARPAAARAAGVDDAAPSQNRPPEWSEDVVDERTTRVDEAIDVHIAVSDPDHESIKVDVTGMPAGMKHFARPSAGAVSVDLHWRPGPHDLGRHDITLTASDGVNTSVKTLTILVTEEWQSYFLPGLQYVVYDPSARSTYGTYQGVSAEIVIASWIHRNENRGPSHGRVYVDMDVTKSSHDGMGAAFDLSLGFDLSIERNPTRRFLLPYFGLKFGGKTQKGLPNDGFLFVTPLLGVYLYADRNVFVSGSVGYVMPMRGASFDDLRGVRATLGVNFTLW